MISDDCKHATEIESNISSLNFDHKLYKYICVVPKLDKFFSNAVRSSLTGTRG